MKLNGLIQKVCKPGAKTPQPEGDGYNDPPRPFIEHFIELRTCLIRCVASWFGCVLVMGPFAPTVMQILQRPLLKSEVSSQISVEGLDVTIGIEMLLKIMLWGGTLLAFPFLLFFILRFIFPGLKTGEKNMILFTLITAAVLFTGGVWMGFAFTIQIAVEVFMAIAKWMNINVQILQVQSYIAIVLKTLLAFGIAFQLPLILLVLGWLGLISSQTLVKNRSYAVVMVFVIAMVLTPPEPVSQIIMAIPMCLLYELCILLIRAKEKIRG